MLTSTAVLGIGVVALADLHTTSEKADQGTRARDVAAQIAIQRMEQLATQPIERLPDCPGFATCRAGRRQMQQERSTAGSFRCSQLVDQNGFSDGSDNDPNGKYRIDTSVNAPTATSQQEGARMITVSVCWVDHRDTIQEVQIERLVVPEL